MIRVSVRAPDGSLSETLQTDDPVEAEVHYLRLCHGLRDEPAVVRVVSRRPDVPRGAYRLDRGWHQDKRGEPPREQERERYLQIWARPDQGWTGPSPSQIRAALHLAGLTQTGAARALGVSDRAVRYWCAGRVRPDWSAWALLLAWAGHPVHCRRG